MDTAINTQEGSWVPITQITVPDDARPHTPEDVDSRAASLARDGQLENILLSKEGDKLVLVYGHGRLLSAQKLGWEKIRADIREGMSETQKLLAILAENEEREDASPFFTARLYQKLMEKENLTQEKLAEKLGKALRLVEGYARLAKVSPEVRQTRNALRVSLRQCLEIAKLTKVEDQQQVLEECATQDLSGKALESRIQALLGKGQEEAPAKPPKAVPAFQFKWKGRDLIIKVRPFHPDQESWAEYSCALDDASQKYRMAFPAAA